MVKTIEAIYSGGVLKPLQPLDGIAENGKVTITITALPPAHPLAGWTGGVSNEDAAEMVRVIEDEFEKVNPDDWK